MEDASESPNDGDDTWGAELGRRGLALAKDLGRAYALAEGLPIELKERLFLLAGRAADLDTAADFYARYLDGTGGVNRLSRDQTIALEPFASAETENKERFEKKTFVGGGENPDVHLLPELEDGQQMSFSDHWARNFNVKTFIKERLADGRDVGYLDLARELVTPNEGLSFSKLAKELAAIDPDFTLSFGASTLKSEGKFDAVRRGDIIHIEGVVTHSVNDDYDFNPGQENSIDAQVLEYAGYAKPFKTEATWRQPVTARVRVEEKLGAEPTLRVIGVEWGEPVNVPDPALHEIRQ